MRISDWSSDVCSSDLFAGGSLGGGGLEAYVGKVFQAVGGQQISYSQPRRTTVNGLEAAVSAARANTQSGPVDVTVTAYRGSGDQAFHFLTITPASTGAGPFAALLKIGQAAWRARVGRYV